jgi:acyl-coenzyme A thioesterase PaaI-like protein
MINKYFQENYSEDFSHCYGCGTQNEHGHQIKSYWEGDTSICRYKPEPHHTAIPGFVYGGLIASLIDCHSTGTGAAALYEEQVKEKPDRPYPRCVTASLNVDYIKPTPIDCELILKGRVFHLEGRKVIISVDLFAKDQLCARGEATVVQVPEGWKP